MMTEADWIEMGEACARDAWRYRLFIRRERSAIKRRAARAQRVINISRSAT